MHCVSRPVQNSLYCGFLALATLLFTPLARAQEAQDKNGVSPNVISRPTGPGSLEGLGDAFQPALNTGMAKYAVQMQLPPGVAGFTPLVGLTYDMGNGQGPVGIGWKLDVGCIRRQTDKGLPRYNDGVMGEAPDRFIGMEEEELVPLNGGFYLAKIEGTYLRYQRVGDHWEARSKSGILLKFGQTANSRVTSADGSQIYKWCLDEQVDTHGNVIQYTYELLNPADRRTYLREIRYGPGAPLWNDSYSATFNYETRSDTFTDYRSGFKVKISYRLSSVDIQFNTDLIRRYTLGYEAHDHWSLLTTVTTIGNDSVSALPSTTFEYNVAEICNPTETLSANDALITSGAGLAAVMDDTRVDLIDLNGDSLPDILDTGLLHSAYINRGPADPVNGLGAINWEGPIDITALEPRVLNFDLSEADVHLSDMTGDGIADFVITDDFGGEFFENMASVAWGASHPISDGGVPPPSPMDPNNPNVKTGDFDFDKRIDIIRSDDAGYTIWFNQGNGNYSAPVLTDGAVDNGEVIQFDDPGVELADLTGDRLNDVVQIQSDRVVYCASLGRGNFAPCIEIPLPPGRTIDVTPDGNLQRASMQDVNADGLADLVVERAQGDDLWIWLNLGNNTFSSSCTVTNCPTSSDAVVRWADINGNGTTDLIYADSFLPTSKINAVDIGLLLNGSPHTNLLKSISNGYGRKTDIIYKTSTEYLQQARSDGNEWTTTIPFPTSVVGRTETSIGLDLDGFTDEGPNGDTYITDFTYRDGYYDPLEKQFRGFGFVKQIELGDERFGGTKAPTLVTRFRFHTGAPDGFDNDGDGQIDEEDFFAGREEEPLKGVELWRELTILPNDPMQDGSFAPDSQTFERHISPLDPAEGGWTIRNLCTATGGAIPVKVASLGGTASNYFTDDFYSREVRQSVRNKVVSTMLELGAGTPKTLVEESDIDVFGNDTIKFMRGDTSNPHDNMWQKTEYAHQGDALGNWMLDRVGRVVVRNCDVTNETEVTCETSGTFVSETRNFYDGDAFMGLGAGEVGTRGVLHRTEALVGDGTAPALTDRSFILGDPRNPTGTIDVLRQQVDQYGNPEVLRDARGNDRIIGYDAVMQTYPESELIVVGDGSDDLLINATYDYRWGKPLTLTDFNGNTSRFNYDQFGRLFQEYLPGDPDGEPTMSYQYNLGMPFSSIVSTAHPREGGLPGEPPVDVITTQYFDGIGRKLGMYENGGNVMREVTLYNPRGTACKVYQPYTGHANSNGTWTLPPSTDPAYTTTNDAKGRATEIMTPPDQQGVIATMRKVYEPLRVIEYDGEDNRTGSPHENTPKTLVFDGLERLIEVHEIEGISTVDAGTFITRYRYALPDLLAEIEDANGNIKYMRYDGLGRKIFMNDLNRGHMTYTYDAASNLVRTMDAKLQEIVYGYDGANRLKTEDYLDTGHPLSLNRSPDVIYHYDAPSADYPNLTNLKGKLSYVEDLTGAEYFGYNQRGQANTTIKRIDQIGGGTKDYQTSTLVDNLDRVYQIVYPDGGVVRQTYDARGLLQSIPNFAPAMDYEPSGQPAMVMFQNGVVTLRSYDPRLRLQTLFTDNSSAEIFQDLSYTYDQVDNITNITDGRTLPMGEEERSQTASYLMDNLYRLRQANGAGYGIINYDYDRLGNMALKQSGDIADPDVNIGDMLSGQDLVGGAGQAGTSNRIGREVGDAPGPHALTSTTNVPYSGSDTRSFAYDDNGNMTNNNGDLYVFDFKDRLGDVDVVGSPTPDIRYLYDYSDRRVIKRVDGNQTSYINRYSEIRDGELVKYVWNGDQRLAKVTGDMPAAPVATQFIDLKVGWNAISFQIDPGSTDIATILADIDGNYDAIYGYDGTQYLEYLPGGMSNTLTELLPNHGYWVFMNTDATLQLEGPVSTDPVMLSAGWHFVGIPGLGATSTTDLLTQYPEIDRIWATADGGDSWQVAGQGIPSGIGGLGLTPNYFAFWIRDNLGVTLTQNPGVGDLDTEFFHSDHTKSTSIKTDENVTGAIEILYYPFGVIRFDVSQSESSECRYWFIGKETDIESNLVYIEARYYRSQLARFITVDPYQPDHDILLMPQMMNVFSYSFNRPMVYSDPSGQMGRVLDVVGVGLSKKETADAAEDFARTYNFKFDLLDAIENNRINGPQARELEELQGILEQQTLKELKGQVGKEILQSVATPFAIGGRTAFPRAVRQLKRIARRSLVAGKLFKELAGKDISSADLLKKR